MKIYSIVATIDYYDGKWRIVPCRIETKIIKDSNSKYQIQAEIKIDEYLKRIEYEFSDLDRSQVHSFKFDVIKNKNLYVNAYRLD